MKTNLTLLTAALNSKSILTLLAILGIASGALAQTPADIPPGLIAWWRAENSTADVLGNVPGALMDGATYAAGQVGQGFLFNGSTSAVALGNSAALDFAPDSSFSIEAWFNSTGPNDAGNDGQVIVLLNNNCGNTLQGLVFSNAASTVGFGVRDANGLGSNAVTPGTVSRNQYHHAVGVREVVGATKTLRLYLDGVLVSTASDLSTGSLVLNAPDWIGRRNPCATWNVFKGVIDEVAIYGRALTAAEAAAIFAAGTSGKSTVKPYFTNADTLPGGSKGTPYSFQFATAVAPGPHTFTVTGGTMPPGLELSSTGLLYGTPTTAVAAASLNVTATAPSGQSTTRTFSVNILPCLDPAPTGQVAWWRGQDDALDATGTSHGTLKGNATYAAGKVGQGFTFDGSGDYVEVPNAAALNFGTGDFTAECWVKFNSTSGEQVLMEKYSGAGWTFTKLSGNQLHLSMAGGAGHIISPSLSISTGVWHHFAARRSGGTGTLFMNGATVFQAPVAGDVSSTNTLKIGSRGGGNFFVNGQMDEVALFNRALSDAEILAIYNAGSSGKCGAVIITTLSPLPGTGEGTAYSQTLAATGGTAPYNFTVLSGTPPAGLTLSSGGVLSGTPTATGLSDFTVRVTDAQTRPATRHYTLRVNARPVLGTITNKSVNELALLTVPNPATDPDPLDTLTYSLVSPPAGAAISNAGTITWTPTEAQGPSVFTITTLVTDNGSPPLTQTNTFTVTVTEVNALPTLTPKSNTTIPELTLFTLNNAGSDTDLPANNLTYSLTTAPPGASIGASTGIITWTPTETQGPGGPFTFTTRVDDNGTPNQFNTNTFTVTVAEVNVAPVLPPLPDRNAAELALMTVNATATDADLPANTLNYQLLAAPVGADISSGGVITWTPAANQGPATHLFTVRVTDNGTPPLNATDSFHVTVTENNTAPVLPSQTNKNVNELALLNVNNAATDADEPASGLHYSLLTPPAGAAISATGVITWTPTEAQGPGTFTITTQVTDNGTPPLSSTNSFQVTVGEVNVAPVLGSLSNFTVTAGQTVSFTATATDADLPANTLTFSLLSPPAGATINSSTGAFSWVATTTSTIQVRVTDNGTPPLNDTKSFTVTVSGTPPVGGPELRNATTVNGEFRFEVHGATGGNYTIEYTTDFVTWVGLERHLSAVTPFNVADPGFASAKRRFYRATISP